MDAGTLRQNRLLASLGAADLEALQPHLRLVDLEAGVTLLDQDDHIDQLFFPITAAVSLLTVLDSGDAHEHVMVGREGMVGFPALLDDGLTPFRALVQVPGEALLLPRSEVHGPAAAGLRRLATRYAVMLLRLTGQAAACSANHVVEERIARCLLRLEDLTGTDSIAITHEFIALLLGVQRQTVTIAAGRLQRAGLVQYARGRIAIVDRDGLERASCECYRAMRRAEERLFD
ncbi:MAG: Crp/Fnr family transcriptional regulator [Dehalococcoidia bacterium]